MLVNGPALDKEIGPAQALLEKEEPLFKSMKYQDYFEVQQKTRFADKSGLDEIRLNAQNWYEFWSGPLKNMYMLCDNNVHVFGVRSLMCENVPVCCKMQVKLSGNIISE